METIQITNWHTDQEIDKFIEKCREIIPDDIRFTIKGWDETIVPTAYSSTSSNRSKKFLDGRKDLETSSGRVYLRKIVFIESGFQILSISFDPWWGYVGGRRITTAESAYICSYCGGNSSPGECPECGGNGMY